MQFVSREAFIPETNQMKIFHKWKIVETLHRYFIFFQGNTLGAKLRWKFYLLLENKLTKFMGNLTIVFSYSAWKIGDECGCFLVSYSVWIHFSKHCLFLDTMLLSKSILVYIISNIQMSMKYFPGSDWLNLMYSNSWVEHQ